MKDYKKHLYMIVYPINALVASQLPPAKFAEHYTVGSAKHFKGKAMFVEVDIDYRDDYFEIDRYLALTAPHADGSPKKTKFISSYAVLEHVALSALKDLYLVTVNGRSLKIPAAPYNVSNRPGLIRIYQEIVPLRHLVASTIDQRGFGKYVTGEAKAKGAPKVMYTQFKLDIEGYLARFQERGIVQSPFPEVHPMRLRYCLEELKQIPEKKTKTITLNSVLLEASYRLVRHGFWFAAKDELLFYPMPTVEQLERDHYSWWKHAQ